MSGTTKPLSLADQLRLSREVARLVRARLPLVGHLLQQSEVAGDGTDPAAAQLERDLSAGRSLMQSLASDSSRDSQILAACIEAGERSGALERTLEIWCDTHIADQRDNRATRTAMVYPALLIVVTTLSLAFAIRTLIPEYRKTYGMFVSELPQWLDAVSWFQERLGLSIFLLAAIPSTACLAWLWRRRTLDRQGMPRMPARRSRLAALATTVSADMVAAGMPVEELLPIATRAMGARADDVGQASQRLLQQQPIDPLPSETSLLLASLNAGLIQQEEAVEHLRAVAAHLREEAESSARRDIHWIPIYVSLVVGALVILTYIFLIYLPWVLLLIRIVDIA